MRTLFVVILLSIFTITQTFGLYQSNNTATSLLAQGDKLVKSGKPKEAIKIYENSLRKAMDTDNRWQVTKSLYGLIKVYEILKDKKKVTIYQKLITKSYEIIDAVVFGEKSEAVDQGENLDMEKLKKIIAKVLGKNKNLQDSIMFYITDIATLHKAVYLMKDSLNTQKIMLEQINEELDEKKDELTRVEAYLQNRTRALFFSFFVILIIAALAVLAYRSYIIKRKQHHQLMLQEQEIRKKNEVISFKNEQITGSIRYAERIQNALSPSPELFKKLFPESFIFFKPKDIVSGDFYWFTEKNGKIIVAAVDCTGHGVPGAFMSILGIKLLDEIVNKNAIVNAGEILDKLRENIISSFHQNELSNPTKDGMDLALITIDKNAMQMQFAGAYNPMLLVRNGEITQYKADRQPAAYHDKHKAPFKTNSIDIQKNDRIFLASDGFLDQIGGNEMRKFMMKNFSKLLVETSNIPMNQQVEQIEKSFNTWKNEFEQVDDVMVLGLKI